MHADKGFTFLFIVLVLLIGLMTMVGQLGAIKKDSAVLVSGNIQHGEPQE